MDGYLDCVRSQVSHLKLHSLSDANDKLLVAAKMVCVT